MLPSSTIASVFTQSLSFQLAFSNEAIVATIILTIITAMLPVILSLRRFPKNSIIVGTNSAAISAQCHRPRQPQLASGMAHANSKSSASIGGYSDVSEFAYDDGRSNPKRFPDENGHGHDISLRTLNVGSDQALPAVPPSVFGKAQAESESLNGTTMLVVPGLADYRDRRPSLGNSHNSYRSRGENDFLLSELPSQQAAQDRAWLQPLKWGVLVQGSVDPQHPGQLGLAPVDLVIGPPVDGHYYA